MKVNGLNHGLKIIADLIPAKSKVLDLGCGDGSLLYYLHEKKEILGWGVDIKYQNVVSCIQKGISVFQGDIESGIQDFQNDLYDFVIISQTLQEIKSLEKLLFEALRIGRKVIVTFPNFGFISNRIQLFFKGTSPVSTNLPFTWYHSPNVHFFTIKDFRSFCQENNIQILREIPYCESSWFCRQAARSLPNKFAQHNLAILHSSMHSSMHNQDNSAKKQVN